MDETVTPHDVMHPGLNSSAALPTEAILGPALGTQQRTLRGTAECFGVGVHSGEAVALRLLPAPENTGIVFIRTDLKNGARHIPALWDHVVDTKLCTVIGNRHGGKVATVEHLMAAL